MDNHRTELMFILQEMKNFFLNIRNDLCFQLNLFTRGMYKHKYLSNFNKKIGAWKYGFC